MPHHTIIYNPAAGQGLAGERVDEVRARLASSGVEHTVHLTEGPGHATELAAQAAEAGSAVVVAAGGDGTVNESINGLMSRGTGASDRPAFGVLCVGRGNDFAYGAGIPTDLDGCFRVLLEGHTEGLDVGHLRGGEYPDGRYFGNGIGIGFDTIVGLEATKLRAFKGFSAYLVAAFKTLLFYYKTPFLHLVIDGVESEQRCIQVSVMNGQRLGGAFFMAPDASTRDGKFDLCIAGKPRRGQMLGLLLRYMKGTQADSPHIATCHAQSFSVRAIDGSLPIHADGETISIDGQEISFECIASALKVVTSPVSGSSANTE